jgi:hypothetical protein
MPDNITNLKHNLGDMVAQMSFGFAMIVLAAATPPPYVPPAATVKYQAYLGNTCMGEPLEGGTLDRDRCVDISKYEEAFSFEIFDFKYKNQKIRFYYDDNCTDQTGDATSEECYIVNSDVKSLKYTT